MNYIAIIAIGKDLLLSIGIGSVSIFYIGGLWTIGITMFPLICDV